MNNSAKKGAGDDTNHSVKADSSPAPNTAVLTLKKHQVSTLHLMQARDSLALFLEAGTGKTNIVLQHVYNYLIEGKINNCLIIVPSALIKSWDTHITKLSKFGFLDYEIDMIREAVHITSFRRTWKAKKGRSVILREDVDKYWDMIVIDESHRLGAHNSLQTKACLKLAKNSTYRYILTGTPDSTKYEKLYGQIKFLDPDLWRYYKDFYRCAVIKEDYFRNPEIYNIDWCEDLKREYGTVQRLRECVDLPLSSEIDIPLDLAAKTLYKDIVDGKFEKHNITLMGAGTGFNKLLQISSGHMKHDDGVIDVKTEKLNALKDIIEGTDDKVVIFAKYRRSIERIMETLAALKVKIHRFDGTVQEPVWQEFQKDDSKVIVVQYQRGGVGIDLFASSTCIFYEPTFSAVDLEQSKARIMRIGQEKHCLYYYLQTSDIEMKAWDSVRRGVDVSAKMLDQWAEEERNK